MHVLLAPLGSAGDAHPFVGLGAALRQRGHRVTLFGDRQFESLVQQAGIEFVALEKQQLARVPLDSIGARVVRRVVESTLWLLFRRLRKLARASVVLPYVRPLHEAIARHHVPGQTVVVASSLALGARIAQDRLGVPVVTVHLSPCQFRSVQRPAVLPPLVLPRWLPASAKRLAYRLLDALVLDRLLGDPLNGLRGELGLPPVRRVFDAWRHSPARTIGLFPEWFGMPQPDWPAQARLTGFPLFDGSKAETLPADVQEFLDAGEPPIIFTPSTSIRTVRSFFVESVKASQLLGRRAILLTRFPEQVPSRLPATVRHFAYVPFSQLLARAVALVHFGGIGSAAQALAAGIPQLIVPFKNDQFDNAARLQELAVARVLSFGAYRAPAVAQALQSLLESAHVADRCREFAARLQGYDALEPTCRLIEEVHQSHAQQVANLPARWAG